MDKDPIELVCHEAKGCEGRLYSTLDEECRICAEEEPLPPEFGNYEKA